MRAGARVLALCLFTAIPALTPALALAAGALEKLRSFTEQTHSAKADFTQTVVDRKGAKVQSATGRLAFQRPGRFRWEYDKPYQQSIVGDGEKLWVYDRDLAQVTVKKLTGALGSSPAALLAGSNDLEEHFQLAVGAGGGGLDWVEATPRTDDTLFKRVRLGFRGKELETMELADHLGQQTVIRFSHLVRNPSLGAEVFHFTPPAGVDVVTE